VACPGHHLRGFLVSNPAQSGTVTTVYLIRHGRTDLNANGRLRGRIDPPLDEVGRAEADRLAVLFAATPLEAVLTSPLQRAVQTATPLAASTNAPLEPVSAFVDRDYGPWNGRPRAEVERRFGSLDHAPGVEPRPALERRVLAGLQAAADQHTGRAFAIVAHDAVNRVLLARVDSRFGDLELVPQRTGCWNRLRQASGRWRVLVIDAVPGDSHHPD
jgi:broad specificity phosphatase PhoE